jgi:eukaryotic-like serine/threonine-protein kinase
MSPDEELTAIARAIIERGHIDWLDVESSADEEVQRSTIRQLKVIAKIAELHRGIADVPASPGLPVTRLLERAPDPVESGPDLAAMPAVLWGPLKLLHRIANGSFGEVFLALDMRLEREVALKLLYQSGALADPVGSAVIEEARLLARVRHPNVVTIYGADRIDNRVGLWMEHVRGRTLQQALKERGRLDAAEVAVIGVEICGALSAVHEAGLLHRDVKAHNVMQQEDGRLVLMDFGAGHELADDGGAAELAGTPLYVAPEILEAQPATVQSDLYSLGVLLYHLLTGSYPVTGRTVREIREHHRSGQRKTIHDARSDVSQPLARAIERALDADQTSRSAPQPRTRAPTYDRIAL